MPIRDADEPLDEAHSRVYLDVLEEKLIPGSTSVKFFIFQFQTAQYVSINDLNFPCSLYDGTTLPPMAEQTH
ncbi:AMP-dependent synthetase/ligase [Penicillium expansum]|nr:AMP-dependent synthetase/ligase [Penicillium expansum]